ncbi:uncharacterized protein LOC127848221 [Dreissena polymorpha]|uniref:Uncharacterized protein n=1 Tax=Dreissena polymorpha TaxID=45954 RepID=A0A9D4DU96_DREPO|nr:uncharacterized protein LOC127848221 [Dreissena polymorpha]KAH3755789.1 hypothetical protein DPMN_190488 [Dreissena polymorpha]
MTLKKMFQKLSDIEMHHMQCMMALYLELACLTVVDHPDAAGLVRLTATVSCSHQHMVSGIMTTFKCTAGLLTGTIFPIILDAIQLQDVELINVVYCQISQHIDEMSSESTNTEQKFHELQRKILENIVGVNEVLKQIQLQNTGTAAEASLGKVQGLREAVQCLDDLERPITRIIQFWKDMSQTFSLLQDNMPATLQLNKIKVEQRRQEFRKAVKNVESDWKTFEKICNDHVRDNDTEILNMYDFLSSSFNQMSIDERIARQRKLRSAVGGWTL